MSINITSSSAASTWSLSQYANPFTLTFRNPTIEATYISMRSHRALSFFPKIMLGLFAAMTLFRRVQLTIAAQSDSDSNEYKKQLEVTITMAASFCLELITHFFDSLRKFRCVVATIHCYYSAAQWAYDFRKDTVSLVPVYPFG